MSRTVIASAILLFSAALLPFAAIAHETGASIEREVNGYLIDMGYSVEAPVAGEPIRLDFAVSKAGRDIPFSSVWVRIEGEGKRALFAGGLARAAIGRTGLLLAFPEEGSYTISARFQNDDATIVEAAIPFPVAAPETKRNGVPAIALSWPLATLLVLAAGGIAFYLGRRTRHG